LLHNYFLRNEQLSKEACHGVVQELISSLCQLINEGTVRNNQELLLKVIEMKDYYNANSSGPARNEFSVVLEQQIQPFADLITEKEIAEKERIKQQQTRREEEI
jgi:hypothetical protein